MKEKHDKPIVQCPICKQYHKFEGACKLKPFVCSDESYQLEISVISEGTLMLQVTLSEELGHRQEALGTIQIDAETARTLLFWLKPYRHLINSAIFQQRKENGNDKPTQHS